MSNGTVVNATAAPVTYNRCGNELLPPDPTLYGKPALDIHDISWLVSGICLLGAILISLFLLLGHFANYNRPKVQVNKG